MLNRDDDFFFQKISDRELEVIWSSCKNLNPDENLSGYLAFHLLQLRKSMARKEVFRVKQRNNKARYIEDFKTQHKPFID